MRPGRVKHVDHHAIFYVCVPEREPAISDHMADTPHVLQTNESIGKDPPYRVQPTH